jgi:hypothetical protein
MRSLGAVDLQRPHPLQESDTAAKFSLWLQVKIGKNEFFRGCDEAISISESDESRATIVPDSEEAPVRETLFASVLVAIDVSGRRLSVIF